MPERYGLGVLYGNTHRPNDEIRFALLSGFAQFTHDAIWPYSAPDALHFKAECSAGATTAPWTRCIASAGLILQYYLVDLGDGRVRPYIEGGCHIIYGDFQVPGQGLRFNFNPQGGIGAEFDIAKGQTFYLAFRLQHISNASLYPQNAGIDSASVTLGRLF
ncbi:MAG: acyloxyacyl hydrolase [Candidatus Coatesbacteria bacterium]|nr:acyloxyacyl hydrolase [Candidatus Coatesbacteria bacterium]